MVGIISWILFDIYCQGRNQKLAVLALLERIKSNHANKASTITNFLQNHLYFTGDSLKKQTKDLLQQELALLQMIMKISSIKDKELLQIYEKLQSLILLYCTVKPPSELNEDKNFKPDTEYEEFLSSCHTKFIKYLEKKDLITMDIRKKIHAFDKTNSPDEPEK
jgi:hypothetical protein